MYNLQGDKINRRVCITCLGLGISSYSQPFSLSWVLLIVFLTACLKLYPTHTCMCQQVNLYRDSWVSLWAVLQWCYSHAHCGSERLKVSLCFLWGCLHFLEFLGLGFLVWFFTQACCFISNETISEVVKFKS